MKESNSGMDSFFKIWNFIQAETASLRFWTLLFLIIRLASAGVASAGQIKPPVTARNSAIETHFTAAQRAQRSKDYSTAVREYQAVLLLAPGFAEVHMNLGLVYQLQERFAEAMGEFHRALKIKPRLAGADFFLGVDYCKLGEGAKAIPHLKAAIETEPDRLETWLWLATAQEMSGQLQAEVVTLHRALELRSNDEDALYLLGSAYERLGKQQVAYLEKVAPGSSRSEQLLAESYAASSEWPSAVIRFQNAMAAAPDRAGLHAELAEVLLRAGKVNHSIQESAEELRRNPGNLRALVRRGEASLIKGNIDAALQDWDEALSRNPGQTLKILGLRETGFGDSAIELLPEANREQVQKLAQVLRTRDSRAAHLALAFLDEQNGDLSHAAAEASLAAPTRMGNSAGNHCTEADTSVVIQGGELSEIIPCAEKILASRPSVDIRMRVSGALLEAGHPDAALNALEGLSIADSGSAEAAFWRARCYEKLATAAYLQIYQTHPNSYRVHQLMGDLESAKGDDAKAIEEYREAIALTPSVPNLHYSLGHLLWKDLSVPEARVELEAELKINPRHAGALNDLGNTYLLEHQASKALPYLERALASNPENPDVHRDLGTAYSELHDYRRAAENFKIAVTNDRDGSVHYKLAKAYQALGQKEQAAREFALSSALNRESHDKLERRTERLGEATKSTEDP